MNPTSKESVQVYKKDIWYEEESTRGMAARTGIKVVSDADRGAYKKICVLYILNK